VNDLRPPTGFDEALRPPVDIRRARLTPSVLPAATPARAEPKRARWERVARRVPEVMVKITGRIGNGGHLKRHLDYISRNGRLVLEGPDRERLEGRAAVHALAGDWALEAMMAAPRRVDCPLSRSIILSMPAGVEAHRVEDAARAFAKAIFGGRFDYVFTLHDEGRHPHVHLSVCALGRDGERLNPRKADLQVWRETFARELRARGLEAEATPRRSRGVVRKAERTPVRKMRERYVAADGRLPRVLETAYRDALAGDRAQGGWRDATRERQQFVRRAYVALALALSRSGEKDRALGAALEAFVRSMPAVETREDRLRRAMRKGRPSGATRSLNVATGRRNPDDPVRRRGRR
jgi:hypothetical protein